MEQLLFTKWNLSVCMEQKGQLNILYCMEQPLFSVCNIKYSLYQTIVVLYLEQKGQLVHPPASDLFLSFPKAILQSFHIQFTYLGANPLGRYRNVYNRPKSRERGKQVVATAYYSANAPQSL